VEGAGPDLAGITFDTGNVPARGEDPLAAVPRVAPYVHSTRIKDAILFFDGSGLVTSHARAARALSTGSRYWQFCANSPPACSLPVTCHLGMTNPIFGSNLVLAESSG